MTICIQAQKRKNEIRCLKNQFKIFSAAFAFKKNTAFNKPIIPMIISSLALKPSVLKPAPINKTPMNMARTNKSRLICL